MGKRSQKGIVIHHQKETQMTHDALTKDVFLLIRTPITLLKKLDQRKGKHVSYENYGSDAGHMEFCDPVYHF